ncbi:glycosyltransferase family 4 protein, partial [Candidatus Kaiserbacteria bacterium]|nr:glycosyltransferase family 4 protein [Candidatus Kaiserbacteria bacterium]
MHIVIATPLYPPEIGGPATYAKFLEEGLPKKGIEVELVKFGDVRHLPKLIRHYVYYCRVLKAACTADAVFALDPVSVGLPAMQAAKKAGKPFVVKIVGDYAWEQGQQRFGVTQNLDDFVKSKDVPFSVQLLRRIQTRVARSATRVIVPSEYLKNIVAAWGISEEKIRVIYNGIELPENIPMPQKKDGEFLIVSAGRRVPWKGFEAIERVARMHKNWRVHIASGVPRDEALGWMKAADVFVLNSSYEGLSHVLIEAMTLGIPVIATNAGGNATLVSDEETGLLVPSGDDVALQKALTRVAENPAVAKERALVAQKRMNDFSVPHMLDATTQLMLDVVRPTHLILKYYLSQTTLRYLMRRAPRARGCARM